MCDGRYTKMQNFLREQSESLQSINMVEELTSFLHQFQETRTFSYDTLILFNQILQALLELILGNFKNCEVIFDANIISVLNYVFQIDITEIKEPKGSSVHQQVTANVLSNFGELEDICEGSTRSSNSVTTKKIDYVDLRKNGLLLKASAVQLLEVMLEKISPQSESLSHQVAEGLDIRALHWSMVDFYILKGDSDLANLNVAESASRALFSAYSACMHLVDNNVGSLESFG